MAAPETSLTAGNGDNNVGPRVSFTDKGLLAAKPRARAAAKSTPATTGTKSAAISPFAGSQQGHYGRWSTPTATARNRSVFNVEFLQARHVTGALINRFPVIPAQAGIQ